MAERARAFDTPGRVFGKETVFGVIVGDRGFFPKHLVERGRADFLRLLDGMGIGYVTPSADETRLGAVGTLEDAGKCGDLFRRRASDIDGVVVLLPNFGDEKAVVNALRRSGLEVPVLVLALADEAERMGLEDRRDSFCGKISVCNNLVQYGIPFSLSNRHTLAGGSDDMERELRFFEAVCRVVRGLKGARLGAIGARPAAFNTVRYSERLLEAAGIAVETVDLSEILSRAVRLDDEAAEVKAKAAAVREYAGGSDVPEPALGRMARLAVALDEWVVENELDAVALQCWTSLEENYGIVPCALMSMMSEALIPAACEVDVMGALSMYVLSLASGKPSALLDWNNNYGEDPDKCVLFHCSNLPAEFFGGGCRMGVQSIIAGSVGEENAFGACEGRIPPGPFTFLRLDSHDESGSIRGYVGAGEFTDDPLETFGGYGVARIEGLQYLMQFVCRNGFAHHVAASRSMVYAAVFEALETYMGWDVHLHFEG